MMYRKREGVVAFDYSQTPARLDALVEALEAGVSAPVYCEDPTVWGLTVDEDDRERLHRVLAVDLGLNTECWGCGDAMPPAERFCAACLAAEDERDARSHCSTCTCS